MAVDRRSFLIKAVGGGLGLAIVVPALRVCGQAAFERTVVLPTEPIDIGSAERIKVEEIPRKIEVYAPVVADAWQASSNVLLGAAYVRRTEQGMTAMSAVCPHLGCAIGWDRAAGNFLCPCHDSRFAVGGDRLTGPALRGLDPLPIEVKDGRLRLTWVRYKLDTASRETA